MAIVLWVVLGAFACALFIPLSAFLFFGVTAFLIFYEIGKHGCVTCYYCKTCTIGMGKLPEFFFKKSGTANVNQKAQKLFPYVYLLMSAIPSLLVAVSIVQVFSIYKFALLAAILAFSAFTGMARRQTLLGKKVRSAPA